jgi:hypothetical protein
MTTKQPIWYNEYKEGVRDNQETVSAKTQAQIDLLLASEADELEQFEQELRMAEMEATHEPYRYSKHIPSSKERLNFIGPKCGIKDDVIANFDPSIISWVGMERSVLAVVWFMATKWRMQLHQALKHIQTKRPIALNRLDWISR